MTQAPTLNIVPRGDTELVLTRVFHAPARLVFDAHTKPELLKRWLHGPDGNWMEECDVDLRVGGRYRYAWKGKDGDLALGGVYREIDAPVRLVNTERFEGEWDQGEAVITMTLDERDGVTTMTQVMDFGSREGRDGAAASGMEEGIIPSYAKLDTLLSELAATGA